jgi:hypothetical protein
MRESPMKRKQDREFEINVDPIDAFLGAAIIGLVVLLLFQLVPALSGWLWQLWKLCQVVLTFWKWPIYGWTCAGVVALVGLLLLKARQDS